MKPIPMIWLATTAIALAAACGSEEEEDVSRTETRTTLDSVEEVSALLGFSLQEALVLQRPQTLPLRWEKAPEWIAYSPSDANTEAIIQFSYRGATIDEVRVECRYPENFPKEMCTDRMETSLQMTIQTDDGALDEVFEVVYRAYNPGTVEFVALDLDFRGFVGSFEMPPTEVIERKGKPIDDLHLGLFGGANDGKCYGSLTAHTETHEDDGSTWGSFFDVASFEDTSPE